MLACFKMGYVSLTSSSPNAKAHIVGAAKGTSGTIIDETRPLIGTYDILFSDDLTHYIINIGALIKEFTLSKRHFAEITEAFVFVCQECGVRGLFHEVALHSAFTTSSSFPTSQPRRKRRNHQTVTEHCLCGQYHCVALK